MRKEKDFQTDFKHSFSYLANIEEGRPGFYRKISDFTLEKNPFDCWTLFDGKFVAYELKISKLKTKFNFKALFSYRKSFHEIECLKRVQSSGGASYVLVNHFLGRGHNDVYFFDILLAERLYKIGSVDISLFQNKKLETMRHNGKFIFDLSYFYGL